MFINAPTVQDSKKKHKRQVTGRRKHNIAKWGIIDPTDTQCECRTDQTMAHLLLCLKCPYTNTLEDINNATDVTINMAYWAHKL